MRRFLQAILLLAGASNFAAAQRTSPSPIDSATLAIQPSWYEGYFESFDAATAALDLQSLRDARLARGEREVRVWTQIEIGVPKRMVRIREVDGRVTGEGVLYWSVPKPDSSGGDSVGPLVHDIVAYNHAGTCGQIRVKGETAACRTRYLKTPDWRAIMREAERSGLWTIPDPSTLPDDGLMTLDGWTIVVELRTSDAYRAYRYNSPEVHRKWTPAAQAIKVAEAFARADEQLAPPDVQKEYRGVTGGQYRSAIKLCDGVTFEFGDDLASAARRANVVMPEETARPGAEYYVELTGIASPEWASARFESKFGRVLSVGEVKVLKPWTGAECRK
ncbi:MAG TPA: hypothetical protein VGP25_04490 [Gemmatimonadaceae bacterium]|nr:hypothetical protein [Gemmatimonadaceae bacterium]